MTSDVAPGGSVLLRSVSWSWIPWTAAYPVLHLPGAEILTVPVRRTKKKKRNNSKGKRPPTREADCHRTHRAPYVVGTTRSD